MGGEGSKKKKKALFIIVFDDKINLKNSNLSFSWLIWSSILGK